MVQKSSNLSWDDLSALLAVAEARSVRAAAELLGLAHTTLARRIDAAEAALGVVVFVRSARGYVLTEAGQAAVAHVARMADEADALRRELAGGDKRPRGRVRVTLPPVVLSLVIAPALPAFRQAFPDIVLEIETGHGFADLDRLQADVAVRLQIEPQADLVGVRLGQASEACYASPVVAKSMSADGRKVPLIAWGQGEAFVQRARLFGFFEPMIACVCPDVAGQAALAEAGVGIAILPCLAGDASPGLMRLVDTPRQPAQTIWVLTHADLRGSERVRVTAEFLTLTLKAALPRFEGNA
jgi:DNA-binding transcriptional LysR family regulator